MDFLSFLSQPVFSYKWSFVLSLQFCPKNNSTIGRFGFSTSEVFLSFAKSKTWLSSVLSVTYRPAVYHNEGLCFWIKVALLDGFRPPRYYVTHVIIRGVCGAQGELGHDVGEVGEPFSCIQQLIDGDCGVFCYNTHKQAVLDCYDVTEKRVSVDR